MNATVQALPYPDCFYSRLCRPVLISKQVPEEWAKPMYGFIMPIIVTLTVATNSFIVIVLSHKYLRTPTNYVLLAMAVSELLTGLSCMPWFLYYYTLSGHKTDALTGLPSFWCYAIPYMASFFPSIFHTMAIWMTVYLAIQRYIYICVPSLVRRFCTIHRSKQVIMMICILAILMYLPEPFAIRHESHEMIDYRTNTSRRLCYRGHSPLVLSVGLDVYYKSVFTTQTLLVHLVPCILLVVFTWKLVRAISIADKRHTNLMSKSFRSTKRKCSEGASTDSESRIQRLFKHRESVNASEPKRVHGLKQNTRMLIVVIILFLMTEIPAALIFILHVLAVSTGFQPIEYSVLNVLLIIRNVLIVVSYPFRFAIYCGMSQQFRDVVRQMFIGKIMLVRDKDNSTTFALVQGTTTDRESDEKRQSLIICGTNGTLTATIANLPSTKIACKNPEKAVQCDPPSEDDSTVPFDPYLADLTMLVDTVNPSHIIITDTVLLLVLISVEKPPNLRTMRLQFSILICLSLFIYASSQMPDITYTVAWHILPYTPMAKLYNFVQNINLKDKTTKAKLERAKKFINNNWGKPKVQNSTYYNTKAKAQAGFVALIKSREAVLSFWNNQLNNQMLKLFNNKKNKVKEYRQMYLATDRTFDQEFWVVVNNWYVYSHYHTNKEKRDALFTAIDTAITNYYKKTGNNNNPIDFSVWPYPEYYDYFINTFVNGYW
ncbi:hypothetical protein WR25_17917 [Diploscapter pachys]|uniref:G-protein coupled receptors family 1 profile domain-containing protein n=1 Tax=Diploscapter pachys TaxID=2018661 RepID=A0A2A2KTD6_9BILA|nr:hypothetical protein WR25_17917 [Diploscapter pachys]